MRGQDPAGWQAGDKVRVRSGPYFGSRGVIVGGNDAAFEIQLGGADTILLAPADVMNFSLAARRAWVTMPKKAGRPKSSRPAKVMVSMRLDVDVRNRLSIAAEMGLLSNREEAVNRWVREGLDALFARAGTEVTHEATPGTRSRGDAPLGGALGG